MVKMNIQLVIIILYIGVLFGISIYVKRRTESSKVVSLLVATNIAGTAVGAASTIGAGYYYRLVCRYDDSDHYCSGACAGCLLGS